MSVECSECRYVNDGRPFWQHIVSSSTGCTDSQYFEELYSYYMTDKVSSVKLLFKSICNSCLWITK